MSDNNFHTVLYDKKYFSQILELWREQYDQASIEKRKHLFKWISEENPFKNDNAPYYLLMDGERVVGMHGHMPLEFSVLGKKQQCCLAHDDLLSMDYRGKGLGKIMLKGTIEKSDSFAGALWFNEPNYRLYIKSGWTDVPNLFSFVKIFDPGVFLEGKIKNQTIRKIIAGIFKKLIQFKRMFNFESKVEGIKIIEIDKFDETFDILFDEVSPRFGIMVKRNRRYLNWKFVKKPFSNYKRYAAFDNLGKLSGYMILKSENTGTNRRGRILDFLVDPEKPEIFKGLLAACCKEFEKDRVEYIQITTSSPLIAALLQKNEFVRSRKPIRFMVKNWESCFEKDFVVNIKNWHITDSDADGDAWTVDTDDIKIET